MVKAFSFSALSARICALLRRSRLPSESVLVVDSRVVPCLVSDKTIDRWLESESPRNAFCVQTFGEISGPAEMARVMASYAGRLRADEVRIVRCGDIAWTQLVVEEENSDLLFRLGRTKASRIFETNAFELTPAAV